MKHLLLILSATLINLTVHAAEIDAAASTFKWTGKKVTGKHFGTLPIASSTVQEKDGKIVGGEIVLDLNKLTVDDLPEADGKKFLAHMKSADFFDVNQWSTAKLVIKSMNGKKAKGELTIKNKTNPVEFAYTENNGVFSGTLTFDRTKFGMIYNSGNFVKNLGDKMIYNDVTLDFAVKVKKEEKKKAKGVAKAS